MALVSEFFIPAMLAVWLVSYVFWPVTPAPEEMELKLSDSTQESSTEEDAAVINKSSDKTLSTIIESDEEDVEYNSDELRVLHNLTAPELKIKDTAKDMIEEFEKKTTKVAKEIKKTIAEQEEKFEARKNKGRRLPQPEEENNLPIVQPESTASDTNKDDNDKRKPKKED
jgi:hypothetical protein